MKKLIIACLPMLAADPALAQSSVTMYGVVDAGLVRESGGIAGSVTKLTGGVESGSRIGFTGTEQLGDGLFAKYTLEMGVLSDSGASAQGGLAFGRQAWVGLGGKYGQVSLGRQYTPLFLALNTIDPFGAISTAGTAANLMSLGGIRMNNTVKYAFAAPGGISVDVSYAPGEQAGDSAAGRQFGALLGYSAGPLVLKLAHHNSNSIPAGLAARTNGKTTLAGATWDVGVVKLAAAIASNKGTVAIAGNQQIDTRDLLLGATLPLGAGKVMASVLRKDDRGATGRDAKQWGIAYVHALSRRTAIYTAYGVIDNSVRAGQAGFYTVGNASDLGSGDHAFNLGMRHAF
ncbi:MAG: porin [Pseudomonadota bacterium]